MARFEIEKNGERFEVEAPDHNAALTALGQMRSGSMTTAETAMDVGTRAMGGVNSAVANVAMLPLRASAWLTGTQGRGLQGAGEQALNP